MTAEALPDVEGGDVARPDTEEEKQKEGYTILLVEYLWKKHERIGDIDQHEQTHGGLPKNALERGTEYSYREKYEGREGNDGDGLHWTEVGSKEKERDRRESPPERNRATAKARECAELQCSEPGNDGGENCDHPELAEED